VGDEPLSNASVSDSYAMSQQNSSGSDPPGPGSDSVSESWRALVSGLLDTVDSILINCTVDARTMSKPECAVCRCFSYASDRVYFRWQNGHLLGMVLVGLCSVDPAGFV